MQQRTFEISKPQTYLCLLIFSSNQRMKIRELTKLYTLNPAFLPTVGACVELGHLHLFACYKQHSVPSEYTMMLHYKSGEWKVRHLAVIYTLATHTNAQSKREKG